MIGVELDPRKITDALPRLVSGLSAPGFDAVSRAIMTTDLVPKRLTCFNIVLTATIDHNSMRKRVAPHMRNFAKIALG